MNGNEFLDKMSLADPAYVEEADRPVKKRTAWRKWGAMAACLAVLLGVGFLFFPTSTPNVPDPVPTELPTLPVSMGPSLGGYGYEGYYVRDISDLKNTSPSQIVSLPDTLPVFRNATGGYPLQVATEEYKAKMLTLCRSVAGRLGWDAENMTVVWDERSDGLAPTTVTATGADGVKIEVDQFMTVTITYLDRGGPLSGKASLVLRTYDSAYELAEKLLAEYQDLMNFTNPRICVTGGDYNIYGEQSYDIVFTETGGTQTEELLEFFFHGAEFACNEDGEPWRIRLTCTDLSDKVGDYPIITARQAQAQLAAGHYISSCGWEMPGEAYIRKVELVYRTGIYDEYFMPYYRFYVELLVEAPVVDGMNHLAAYYVPAVAEEYLAPLSTWDGRFN